MKTAVTLSLISHTNVGKTTLARTLLRRDVGEVLDQAHVTDVSEAYDLIETSSAVLRLWDTPGFGDTARLMKRLRREREPLGWLLHQVWDRIVNRPLWCSQQAVRNIRDEADVVLYLINAAEEPEDAGYVPLELDLLSWMKRPVMLLLNQIGRGDEGLVDRWRTFVDPWPVVHDVLSLDAFTRCWVEEGVLLRRVMGVLEGDKRSDMGTLAEAWNERNLTVFRESCDNMASYLARVAVDSEPMAAAPPREEDGNNGEGFGGRWALTVLRDVLKLTGRDRRHAMAALNLRLDAYTAELMDRMIAAHELEGGSEARIEQRLQDFQVKGAVPISEGSGALAGAVISGALGGLAADATTGGLTLGGGMIAGGILGALGGSALAKGYRLVGGGQEPTVRWAPGFLDQLCRQVLLRYLAVAHFGRGRGAYRDLERPAHWGGAVDAALRARESGLHDAWRLAEQRGRSEEDRVRVEVRTALEAALRRVLRDAYPHAAAWLV